MGHVPGNIDAILDFRFDNPVLAVIVLLAGCFLLAVSMALIRNAVRERRVEKIKQESARYKGLVQLRTEYEPRFLWGVGELSLAMSCSSKAQFDRCDRIKRWNSVVDYAGKNEGRIRGCIAAIEHNQIAAHEYTSRVVLLPALTFTGKRGRIEADLCRYVELHPETQLTLYLSLSYVSPAGRNSYQQCFAYGQEELLAAIAQSHRKDSETERRKRERAKVTPKLRYKVMQRDGFRCVRCGASAADGAKLHVDHIIPVSRGGKTEMSNLQTLCETCNLGKGAEKPEL